MDTLSTSTKAIWTGLLPVSLLLMAVQSPANAQADSQSRLGVGAGAYLPLNRGFFTLSYESPTSIGSIAGRASFSYRSLKDSFVKAEQESDYAARLETTDASVADVNLLLPEVSLNFAGPFFVSLSPSVRATQVLASYLTPSLESLKFFGTGVSAGLTAGAGATFALSEEFSVGVFTELLMQLWSSGNSRVEFDRNNTRTTATFSEAELDGILENLQPYLQDVTRQTTAGAGLTLKFRL